MKISIGELMDIAFFKDFQLIAGHMGMDRKFDRLTSLDGRHFNIEDHDFLLASEGIILGKIQAFYDFVEAGGVLAGLGIRFDYMKSQEAEYALEKIIRFCNLENIPFFKISEELRWIDILTQVNVFAMNKGISLFTCLTMEGDREELPYGEVRIKRILSQMEEELTIPALVYDLSLNRTFFSSEEAKKTLEEDFELEDFLSERRSPGQEVCDILSIERQEAGDGRTWLIIPISLKGETKAYILLLEGHRTIRHFDEFIVRIGYLLLSSAYEQIIMTDRFEMEDFNKFILDILEDRIVLEDHINMEFERLGLSSFKSYYMLIFRDREKRNLKEELEPIQEAFFKNLSIFSGRLALIDDAKGILLLEKLGTSNSQEVDFIVERLGDFKKSLRRSGSSLDLEFGFSDIDFYLKDFKLAHKRADKALTMGSVFYKEEDVFIYSSLGAFAWIDIREDEYHIMLDGIKELLKEENKELLDTLKIYLESNMNYSLTAKKLYCHINTVRKQINEAVALTGYNLDDPVKRIKLEVLLKLLFKDQD